MPGCGRAAMSDQSLVSAQKQTSLIAQPADSRRKQLPESRQRFDLYGERGGTRTLDPMIKSHVLYRLSYALT
jgi:hypothetical protein